jgi:hypothetical protein
MQLPTGFQYSNCGGNKKALLIGINYFGQRGELRGCINDVQNIKQFISSRYGFPVHPNHMVVLTDDQRDPNYRPTKQNIINAMGWLVGGARAGDSLFLHFSGHGGQVRDQDRDETDGMDDVIYPVDHQQTGPLIDDKMHEMLVRYLPPGVRMTVIFDCCHSGTGLDLPYTYNHDGSLKQYNPGKEFMSTLASAGKSFLMRNQVSAAMQLVQGIGTLLGGNSGAKQAQAHTERTRTTHAEVVMFSGCKDSQTSADTFIGGVGSTGAMSYAFIKALTQQPQQSYLSLLSSVRAILQREYSQKPQLSSGHPMDMNRPFFM